MLEKKMYAIGEVKSTAADDESPNGEFEVILSTAALDRDGEVVEKNIFDPLPDHITFDVDHGMSVVTTVGSGVPRYEDGVLKVKGTYASTKLAQEVRTLVREKHIRTTSVAFMGAVREEKDGRPHVVKAELLNGAFVAIPSNREAVVLSAKSYDAKAGSPNAKEFERLQSIHDLAVSNGAVCDGKSHTTSTEAPVTPSEDGKSPASDVAENGRLWLQRARLLVDADQA